MQLILVRLYGAALILNLVFVGLALRVGINRPFGLAVFAIDVLSVLSFLYCAKAPELIKYSLAVSRIKKYLLQKFPDAEPLNDHRNEVNHLLWSIEQLEKSSLRNQGEIDRLVGWVMGKAHSLGVLDHESHSFEEIQALVRNALD